MQDFSDQRARVATWRAFVAERLGRDPRGFRDVAAFNRRGEPAVIRVGSLVEGKPFPTLFWLIDPEVSLKIDRLEASGWIGRLQREVNTHTAFKASMKRAHDAHRALRDGFMSDDERRFLTSHGMMSAFAERGIGGIKEDDRIRCFHTWYAAHWVESNPVGEVVERLMENTDGVDRLLADPSLTPRGAGSENRLTP